MELTSQSYGAYWIFVCKTDDGREIEVKYNPKKDSATTTVLGRGVTASLSEMESAEDIASLLIVERFNEEEE